MGGNTKVKKLTRARMKETGEKYMVARAAVVAKQDELVKRLLDLAVEKAKHDVVMDTGVNELGEEFFVEIPVTEGDTVLSVARYKASRAKIDALIRWNELYSPEFVSLTRV